MNSDVEVVLEAARTSGLLAPASTALVLLSGGRDSVCLLDVACTLLGDDAVSALHVNYGLRADADADEGHCVELCRELGVELELLRVDARSARAGNLQAWARELRYGAAERLASQREALVATGHTGSDQAETVLYRLAASPGRRALLGIPARRGRVVRPLLSVTREQTARYCRARGRRWREDSTNDSDRYARGRVRGELLAALRSIHPAAEANVRATSAMLAEEAAVLDELVEAALGGAVTISLERLGRLEPAVARLVLARLAEDSAGELVPGAGRRLVDVLALGARGGSAALDLGRGVRAVVEYGELRMTSGQSTEQRAPGEVPMRVPGHASFGDWMLGCRLAEQGSGAAGVLQEVRQGVASGALSEQLDADTLAGELLVRSWRDGDRMTPLGLDGSKSVADLLGERRIPRSQRHSLPVVACGERIAWVPGVAVGEPFRITDATTRVAILSATRA